MSKEIKFPDPSYAGLCRNEMTDFCEQCLLKGEGEHFERSPRIRLDQVPTRSTDHLNPRLQFKIHKAKVDILIDHLRGGTIYEAIDFNERRNVILKP